SSHTRGIYFRHRLPAPHARLQTSNLADRRQSHKNGGTHFPPQILPGRAPLREDEQHILHPVRRPRPPPQMLQLAHLWPISRQTKPRHARVSAADCSFCRDCRACPVHHHAHQSRFRAQLIFHQGFPLDFAEITLPREDRHFDTHLISWHNRPPEFHVVHRRQVHQFIIPILNL